MPIDPREIRNRGRGLSGLIDTDRECPKCRYNLKGLPSNGQCPECGRPIGGVSRSRRFTDNLADAPIWYLKSLALGLSLAAAASIISVLCISANVLPYRWQPPHWGLISLGVYGVMAVVWFVGIYIATGPRALAEHTVREPILDSGWLRFVACAMQAGPIFSALMLFLGMRTGVPVFWYGFLGFIIVALFGLVPLSVRFSSLADWAGDTSLSERFKVAAWAMAFLGTLAVGGLFATGPSTQLRGLIFLLAVWSSMGLVVAQFVFLMALFQLAQIATWAIRNSSTASEVNRRLQENRDRHAMDIAERTAAAAALVREGPPPRPPPGPVRTAMDTNRMERPKDGVDPYALAPEEAPET